MWGLQNSNHITGTAVPNVIKFCTLVGHRMTYHQQKGRCYGHVTVLKFCVYGAGISSRGRKRITTIRNFENGRFTLHATCRLNNNVINCSTHSVEQFGHWYGFLTTIHNSGRHRFESNREWTFGNVKCCKYEGLYFFLIFIFSLFFVSGPCARLSWPSRQHVNLPYRIVSYRNSRPT